MNHDYTIGVLENRRLTKLEFCGFSLVLAAALAIFPACAQDAQGDAADLDAVVVTGIRGSLQSSLNLKRDSIGVVDGIIAEDIGKFPDTNLAESLQRISGVSIDRSGSGEGSRVTVRGVGPDFNLVLLNGRQMPATSLPSSGAGISGSRAFDFANLASEAVSELQIYKTARADKPSGGMGAIVDVRTPRPLDNPGFRGTVGVKGVTDRSANNLPDNYPGKTLTPEVSALFSNTFADGRFGIAASASYQARDSGYSRARIGDWTVLRGNDGTTPSRLPLSDEPAFSDYDISNRPGQNDIYARPDFIAYEINAVQRQRRNGQLTAQFAPTDRLIATVDYTYADNRAQRHRDELQTFFTHSPGASSWSDGPVAAPIIYSEYLPANNGPLSFNRAGVETRSELKSVGFNLEWQANDNLEFAFDYHSSDAEVRPDSNLGSSYFLSTSTFIRGDTTLDFSRKLPILNMRLAPGIAQVGPEHAVLSTSGFRSSYNRSEVRQYQASGTFLFSDYQAFDFGLASTEVFNRSAAAEMANYEINGVGTAADYADDIWTADHIGRFFDQFPGYNDPGFSDRFLIVSDFQRLRARGIELRNEELYSAPAGFTNDLRTTEKTRSAYLQWRNTFDWTLPVNIAVGVRYETTEVNSQAQVLPPSGNVSWIAENGFNLPMADAPVFENDAGKYHFWLPNLDVRIDIRENLLLRGSAGKSIGRPGWQDIQSGLSASQQYIRQGGRANRGNPGLLPLESKNFDLSLEWYYRQGSYASLGYFRKNIKNFIGNSVSLETPYEIYTPLGGIYWNEAIAVGGCGENALSCIRDYIFLNHAGETGVNHTGQNEAGQQTGSISGRPGDPLAPFTVTTRVNQRSDTLDGWEISVQHMFGDSGFGIAANYTKVDSGLRVVNHSLDDHYAMVGLSDSANLVIFYDKHDWQIRAAYNWRDEFLSSIGNPNSGRGAVVNPYYTERYGQLDLNVTWAVNERLSVFVEAINLTDEVQRSWTRHPNMLGELSQTGPRYMFGARYRF